MKAPSHQLAASDEEERKCKMVKNENVRQSAIWKTLSNIRTIWEARRGFGRLLPRGLNLVWKMALVFLMGAPGRKGGGVDDASNHSQCQNHLDQNSYTNCQRFSLFCISAMAPSQAKQLWFFSAIETPTALFHYEEGVKRTEHDICFPHHLTDW